MTKITSTNAEALILDGLKAREGLLPELLRKIKDFSFTPTLAIIQVGDRPDSTSFIHAKKSFGNKLGVNIQHLRLSEDSSLQELIAAVRKFNADRDIQGIIVQLPLPSHIDKNSVIEAIDPKKDVDALTSANVKKRSEGDGIMPATARGIRELLDYYDIGLRNKKVAVVGRSELVGKPIAAMCANEGSTVVVCHSQTVDLAEETKAADILISAVGKSRLIRVEHVKKGQIVVDVGISRIGDKGLVGDVDFESVKNVVTAITPVPGGVGPMTVFALFENLVDLCLRNNL